MLSGTWREEEEGHKSPGPNLRTSQVPRRTVPTSWGKKASVLLSGLYSGKVISVTHRPPSSAEGRKKSAQKLSEPAPL